ncbi:hypothetical protein DYB28_005462, partial [Aphanomyces astaci]
IIAPTLRHVKNANTSTTQFTMVKTSCFVEIRSPQSTTNHHAVLSTPKMTLHKQKRWVGQNLRGEAEPLALAAGQPPDVCDTADLRVATFGQPQLIDDIVDAGLPLLVSILAVAAANNIK